MGCGCLILIVAAVSPRLALFFTWVFTTRIPAAYDDNWAVAVLGFIFLPWTALAWVAVWTTTVGVSGFGWLIIGFAFIVDISTHLDTAHHRRHSSFFN